MRFLWRFLKMNNILGNNFRKNKKFKNQKIANIL